MARSAVGILLDYLSPLGMPYPYHGKPRTSDSEEHQLSAHFTSSHWFSGFARSLKIALSRLKAEAVYQDLCKPGTKTLPLITVTSSDHALRFTLGNLRRQIEIVTGASQRHGFACLVLLAVHLPDPVIRSALQGLKRDELPESQRKLIFRILYGDIHGHQLKDFYDRLEAILLAKQEKGEAEKYSLKRVDPKNWQLAFGNAGAINLPDRKGVSMLKQLIQSQGMPVNVLKLTGRREKAGHNGEVIDREALQDYQQQLIEVQGRRQATVETDLEALQKIDDERVWIEKEIKSALGLGGKVRKAGDDLEKARLSARKNIRSVVKLIGERQKEVAEHFNQSILYGRTIIYDPETDLNWHVY